MLTADWRLELHAHGALGVERNPAVFLKIARALVLLT